MPTAAAPFETLQNHVPKAVAESRRLGPLSGMARLNLAVGLPLRNREDLDRFLEQVSDPRSPNYRRYLNAGEFAEFFGPTQADYDKLIEFFQAHGFTVSGTHPNRMILDVTGPVSAIDETLHVNMTVWEHAARGRFFAPDRDPALDIDVTVLDIAGLDNFAPPRPLNVTLPLDASRPLAGSGPDGYYAGNDFRAAYAPGVTLRGAGQTVGLFELDGFFAADVQANFAQAGLPPVPVSTVLLDGFSGAPGSENIEVILDIVMAAYMAPGADVLVYEGLSPNDVLNRMATDNIARQLSCSWVFSPINATTEQIFTEMIAQGQSLLQASGDSGAYGPSNAIWPPADDPNVTVVGGTALTTAGPAGAWVSESAWSGSGGGVSTTYPIPSYQQGMNMAAIGGSNTMRNIPDVASLAAIQIFLICNDGEWVSVGGTSAAAPLWAGFMALANQQAAANGDPPVGFLNPTIYAIGKGSDYASDLHDIVTGSNGFSAAPGYDLATGWGTIAGQPLINDLASMPAAPSFGLSASPTTVSIQAGSGASAAIQVTPHNGFSGAVSLSVAGLPNGVNATFGAIGANGASQVTLNASSVAAPGNYPISVLGASGTLTASVGLTLQVTAAPSFSLQPTPSAVSVIQSAAGTASIAVKPANGFSGAVSLTVSGLPSGVTASFSPASTASASTLSFAASASAALGAATVTVKGAAGGLSATCTIALTVAPPANFSLVASPTTLSVVEGAGATDTITVTPKSGFSGTVALAVTGLPSGVTASFNPVTTATKSTLTFTAASSAPTGTAAVTVTGTVGAASASVTIGLTVSPAPSFTLAAAPASLALMQSTQGTATIALTPVNGFTGAANLTIAGLPSGVTAAFNPASITSTSKLTLTATASAAIGAATLTITATSGSISAKATLALTVAPLPSFSLASSASNVNVAAGATGTATVTVNRLGGFSGTVALTASGLPTGVTAAFNPASTTATSTLTLTASNTAALKASQFTVMGTSGSLTATVPMTVTVTPPQGFALALAPSSLSLGQGMSGTSTVAVTPSNGFTGSVSLAISGLPTGVTAAFSPASTSSSSTLTLTASASAAIGTATATITGTSGGISAKATLSLTLSAAGFTLAAAPASLSVAQGTSGTSMVTATALHGFTGTINVTIGGLPTGVTAAFSPGNSSSSLTLTLTAGPSAPAGPATVTITGTSGNMFAAAPLALTVTAAAPPAFSVTLAPPGLTLVTGANGATAISITAVTGTPGNMVLSASGLPPGVTASFSPSGAAGTGSVIFMGTFAANGSAAAGTSQVTVTATSGGVSQTAVLNLTVVAPGVGTVPVGLAPYYNVSGIAVDNLPFSSGGLDGGGRSYSGVLLGASQNVGGTVFSVGPMAAPDAVSGQTVTLPAGNFSTLRVLATGVNGSQPGQTFTVTYTDGTTVSFTQSLSDWCISQSYPGESQAVTMNYRDNSTGTADVRVLYLYGYSLPLNNAKTVRSIALPQNRNVVVLAFTLAD